MRTAIHLTALFFCFMLSLAALSQVAEAQTFTVLHSFTGGADGAAPRAGLTAAGGGGHFYGTTSGGGSAGQGGVFRLESAGSGWILTPLFSFPGGLFGARPEARAIIGPNGSLFGTTLFGGNGGDGIVYNLRPNVHACSAVLCSWNSTVIYPFMGGDGASPGYGDLVFDHSGNIYGTTGSGGGSGGGTVFELTPSNGGWTESVLARFQLSSDGQAPVGGVTPTATSSAQPSLAVPIIAESFGRSSPNRGGRGVSRDRQASPQLA